MKTSALDQFHYGWIICLTGSAVLFACLGLGRFSLGMLLPSMGVSLHLNYSQMGLISTGNFIGYMISVVLAGMIVGFLGARRTITTGLIIVAISMIGISRSTNFQGVLALYLATGIGTGLANVPLMGLVSHWFSKDTRGRAAGIMVSGNGIGIVFTGFFIPWVSLNSGGEGWRIGWLTIGVISAIISVISVLLLRNNPREKGLLPLGQKSNAPVFEHSKLQKKFKKNLRTMIHIGAIYFLFGATYVVYATFIITAMVNERHFGEDTAGRFWAVVGGLSIFSGPLFGWLSDKLGREIGMIIVFILFTISYALAAANLSNPFLYASIVIFGIVVWSIPTIMSAAVGDYLAPEQAVKAFGFITLFFGVGQIVGPALAGYTADISGNFNMAFWLCSILTTLAVFLAYFLGQPNDGQ